MFDGNCVEQLYSLQPLSSCATVSINAPFNLAQAFTTIISKHNICPCVRFSD